MSTTPRRRIYDSDGTLFQTPIHNKMGWRAHAGRARAETKIRTRLKLVKELMVRKYF